MATSPPGKEPPPPEELAVEKLALEVDKLRAEVRQLRWPNLGWLTALATVLVSSVGLGLQCSKSQRDAQEVEIKAERAKLDLQLATIEKARLDTIIQRQVAELGSLGSQLTKKVAQAETSLVTAQGHFQLTGAGDSATHAAASAAIRQATQQVTDLGKTIQQRTAQAQDTLSIIQASLNAPGGLRPGSAIVITLKLPYRAVVTYRRWITRELSDTLGTFSKGEHKVQVPYGGYMYFDAHGVDSTGVLTEAANCERDCTVEF
jgi:hypothetical protein